MKPKQSYIIWFSQRTGSTVLGRALEDTGIAGRPQEWLLEYDTYDLHAKYGIDDPAALQEKLWELGTTPNGVFGMKVSMHEPHHTRMTEQFTQFPGCPQGNVASAAIWENAFPNCRHVFMTRRDKVRLAVSWWKAIKTGEFHRVAGEKSAAPDVSGEYLFDAIRHLVVDAGVRESHIQAFFDGAGIVPLTVVYEDFIADPAPEIRRVLDYLDIPGREKAVIPPLHYEKLADAVSEEWVERFRAEFWAG
jgi:trehalose 2-sulfotransferase